MSQFRPMLASKADLTKIHYPVYVSPKYDGIRAVVINGVVYSRSLKLIPNKHVQKLFGKKIYNGYDGELIVGDPADPRCFIKTTSAVSSIEGEPDVKFYVFDKIGAEQWYRRIRYLSSSKSVCIVKHEVMRKEDELLDYEETILKLGYEGVMIRSPSGLYKYGRSTVKEGYLLKLKRFEDSEAKVIGFRELMINNNESTINELGQKTRSSKKEGLRESGMLGSFIVQDIRTGVEFDIGTGFTDIERTRFWLTRARYLNQLIKYKFQPAGVKDKPRFPVFLGFRDASDM
jgi:DNA ligase-1